VKGSWRRKELAEEEGGTREEKRRRGKEAVLPTPSG